MKQEWRGSRDLCTFFNGRNNQVCDGNDTVKEEKMIILENTMKGNKM